MEKEGIGAEHGPSCDAARKAAQKAVDALQRPKNGPSPGEPGGLRARMWAKAKAHEIQLPVHTKAAAQATTAAAVARARELGQQ